MDEREYNENSQKYLDAYQAVMQTPMDIKNIYLGMDIAGMDNKSPEKYLVVEWNGDFASLTKKYPEYMFYSSFMAWEGVDIFRDYLNDESKVTVIKSHACIESENRKNADKTEKTGTKSFLSYVNFVSFQLTYRCSFNCVHCFQKNIKKHPVRELSAEEVKAAILHLYDSDLNDFLINFTGGEVLGNRDDIFEIIEFTHSLGIQIRLNTNSWWADKTDFTVGKLHFASARHLVEHMKSLGVNVLAFSCDMRLNLPEKRKNLISSIKLCEAAGVTYQLVFTGVETGEMWNMIFSLSEECGKLEYMIPVRMEMVDIGAAAELDEKIYCWQSNKAPCNKKGFYRPTSLHISPDGKVRTCRYALGLSDCGSLQKMTMPDIINNYPHRANHDLFSDPIKFEKAEKELLLPYLHHYHTVIHECTRFVIIARAAEMKTKFPEMDMNEIHSVIAQDIGGICSCVQ